MTAPRVSLVVGAATDRGRVRADNEDAFIAEARLFVVADGMGGHAAGEVASGIVIEAMRELTRRETLHPDEILDQLAAANERIRQAVAQDALLTGMGTTAAGIAAVVTGGTEHWAIFNVGDSRVYRLLDGRLYRVTVDHSEVQELIDAGKITDDEARIHPQRNVVTRSLGTRLAPRVDLWVVPPYPGERFVICSDGLTNEVTDAEMSDILRGDHDPQASADALVRAALAAGGRDNVSVIVVDTQPSAAPEVDEDTTPRDHVNAAGAGLG